MPDETTIPDEYVRDALLQIRTQQLEDSTQRLMVQSARVRALEEEVQRLRDAGGKASDT